MDPTERTLRSAVPSMVEELARANERALVLTGGTLVELHPPRIERADVVLRGETIAQIGGDIPTDLPRADVSGCIVTPAFTVGHTHTYMALAAGMPPPASMPRCLIDHLHSTWWPLDRALDDDLVHTSALVAAAMAAKAGATCLVDLHSSPSTIPGSLDRVEAAFDEIGIRGALAYETTDREGRLRRDAALEENRRYLEKVRSVATRHRALVGAHAMMSLNDDTLDALRALADEFAVGLHMHVAEDATDALDAQRNRGTHLDRRLERIGLARSCSVVAHAVELAAEGIAKLASAGAFVATNPRSNMHHGMRLFTGGGDHIALGTDGVDGDVLAEARAFAYRHAEAKDGLAHHVGARIAAGQALRSRLFGEPPARLVAGARADLAVLDYEPMTPMTPMNIVDHVARGWSRANVRHTICGGDFLLRDRVLTNIDERALVARARPAASRLWERMHGYA